MAEQIPKIYGDLIEETTKDIRPEDFESANVSENYARFDWLGRAADIESAIEGAKREAEFGDTPEEREKATLALPSLQTRKNDLDREYQKYMGGEIQRQEELQAEIMRDLAEGKYKATEGRSAMVGVSPGGVTFTDQEKTAENLKGMVGDLTGVPEDKIDVTSGIGAGLRGDLGVLPTDEDKAAHLERHTEGVLPTPMDGGTGFWVKEGDKLVLANEMGPSMGDVAQGAMAVSREGLPTLAALGAGIAAAPSVMGTTASAGAAYTTVAAGQDAAIRKAYGLDANILEAAGRRGKEALFMAPVDLLTMGGGKFFARRFSGKAMENAFAQQFTDSADLLRSHGIAADVPRSIKLGPGAWEAENLLARQKIGGGKLAGQRAKNLEPVNDLLSSFEKGAAPEFVPQRTLSNIRSEVERLSGEMAQKEGISKKALGDAVDARLVGSRQPIFSKGEVGNLFREAAGEAKAAEKKIHKAAFTGIYDDINRSGWSASNDDVIKMYKDAHRGHRGYGKSKSEAYYKELERLNKIKESNPGGRWMFEDVRNLGRDISKLGQAGPTPGGTNAETLGKLASEKFDDSLTKSLGPAARQRWGEVNEAYKTEMLKYNRGSLGGMLTERYGEGAMISENVVDSVTKFPSEADTFLAAIAQRAPDKLPDVTQKLKAAYLDRIGLTSRPGVNPKPAKYDPEMLNVLYGKGQGPIMAQRLDDLNKAMGVKGLNLRNLDPADVAKLEGALSRDEVSKVTRAIAEKAAYKSEQDSLLRNRVISKAMKQNWEDVDNGLLSSVSLDPNTPARDVKQLWNRMDAADKEIFRQDFASDLINSYRIGGEKQFRAPFHTMPNAEDFLKDIGRMPGAKPTQKGRELLAKMNTVLGPTKTKKLIATMDIIQANQLKGGSITKDELRTVIGMGGVSAYLTDSAYRVVHNNLMALAFSSPKLSPLVDLMARDVGAAQYEKALTEAVTGLMTTSRGMRALSQQMSRDPEFAKAMTEISAAIGKEKSEK